VNPLRSEEGAFRILLWCVGVLAVVVVVVELVRAVV
jgi:hypothetical protein